MQIVADPKSSQSSIIGFTDKGYTAFVVLLVAIGLWLRLRNLGALSLMVDEGVEALAIRSILDDGWPDMESGLVYLRFPLFLYVQAAFAALFELNEFWLRFPGILFGAATIPAVYVLGKEIANKPVAAAAATIIALSAWHIDISRYGRPYIALQFFFVLSLLFLYRGFLLDSRRSRYAFLCTFLLTVLTHELGQVLIVAFLVALLCPGLSSGTRLRNGIWGIGLAGLMVVVRKLAGFQLPDGIVWASVGGDDHAGFLRRIFGSLGLPLPRLPQLTGFGEADPALLILVLGIVAGGVMFIVWQAYQTKEWRGAAIAIPVIGLAAAYQVIAAGLLLAVYLAVIVGRRKLATDRTLLAVMVVSAITCGLWLVILVTSAGLGIPQALLEMSSFPEIYKYLFRWLIKGWPVLGILFIGASVWLFARLIRRDEPRVPMFLLGSLYFPAIFASVFESSFVPTYIAHLFPVVILIVVVGVWQIGTIIANRLEVARRVPEPAIMGLLLVVLLLVNADFNIASAYAVGDRTYQSERHPVRNIITFHRYSDLHQDFKGPATYVGRNRHPDDVVAAIGMDYATQIYHFYSGGVDFGISTLEYIDQFGLEADDKIIHYTTGYEYIVGENELRHLLDSYRGRLWILGDLRVLRQGPPLDSAEPLKEVLRDIITDPEFIGEDGFSFATKVK